MGYLLTGLGFFVGVHLVFPALRNIKRFPRHPMLWGLVLWSAHLAVRGDLAAISLFGGLVV